MTFDQADFQLRCEWGQRGLKELAPVSDVVILVDILSFTTALDIATARGAEIFPYPLVTTLGAAYAEAMDAQLATVRGGNGHSLSPASLESAPAGLRLVLPSANGSALSFATHHPCMLAACLRNAPAVAALASRRGSTVAVIPAGETWLGGELRPCLEDLIGAGAVIAALSGSRSPEAELAAACFERFHRDLAGALKKCGSGKELLERGFERDIELAAEHDVSRNVPMLAGRGFVSAAR